MSNTTILDIYYTYTVDTKDYVKYFKFVNENRNLNTEYVLELLEIDYTKERIDE
jgi:hypothetical protein